MTTSKESDDKLSHTIMAICLVPVLLIARGLALAELWRWFMAPLGLPEVGIAHAIGISTLIGMLAGGNSKGDNKKQGPIEMVVTHVVAFMIAWGFGAIVHMFM